MFRRIWETLYYLRLSTALFLFWIARKLCKEYVNTRPYPPIEISNLMDDLRFLRSRDFSENRTDKTPWDKFNPVWNIHSKEASK